MGVFVYTSEPWLIHQHEALIFTTLLSNLLSVKRFITIKNPCYWYTGFTFSYIICNYYSATEGSRTLVTSLGSSGNSRYTTVARVDE